MMVPIYLFLIYLISWAKGLYEINSNEVYKLVYQSSFQSKVSEQCKLSLQLFIANLGNDTNDDQWALQSKYRSLIPPNVHNMMLQF